MRIFLTPVALGLALGFAGSAGAQQGWPVTGGDTGNTGYSTLNQINTGNVKDLRPVWTLQLGTLRSQESRPIIVGDTLFVTSSYGPKYTYAVNAKTGEVKWRYAPEIPKDVDQISCCDVDNRGVAVAQGKVFVGRLDAHLVALDEKTGKEVWKAKVVDYQQGSAITSPPTVAGNVVVTGFAGGEYGVRGALVGYDINSGKELWRTYTVPLGNEKHADTWKGDSGKYGGGSTWNIGSYDPKLNLIYWGTSNPAPWSASVRGNDSSDIGKFTNLYTASVIALDPKDGQIKWHYQFTPHDAWDYDGVNEMVFADLTFDGQKQPVIMHADRNGFFYVLNRESGKLLGAKPFVEVNWASSIDMKTGMPVETPGNVKRPGMKRKASDICPNLIGGKNWMPMSFSQQTQLVYLPAQNLCMDLEGIEAEYKRGQFYLGVNFDLGKEGKGKPGIVAWDPVKQQQVWKSEEELIYNGGTMSTAGGLVFHGNIKGEFKALDAKSGKELWRYRTGSGISQAPVTYTIDGKQYVAVVSGRTLSIPAFFGAYGERMAEASPEGGTLTVFSLGK